MTECSMQRGERSFDLRAGGRWGAGLGVLLAGWLLMLCVAAACGGSPPPAPPTPSPTPPRPTQAVADPAWRLTLQIYNMTDHSSRVTVSQLSAEPPTEKVSIDLVVRPGEMREAKLFQGFVPEAPTVRAYANGRLISCQIYDFSEISVTFGPAPAYSVEIVDGRIAPGCQDLGASQ